MRRFGYDAELLDADQVRAEVNSPTYLGGLWIRTGSALVHPGKLADGLRAPRRVRAGVRVYEHSPVRELRRTGVRRLGDHRGWGRQRAPRAARDQCLPAAGARDRPVHRARLRLRAGDRAARPESCTTRSAGRARQGVSDMGNQFHYYRHDRRRADPVGRVRRGLPLRRPGRPAARRPRADVRAALPALLHDVPAARGRCASAIGGAARSTRAAASRCSSGARSAAASRTRSATPASGSAASRFGARVGARSARRARERGDRADDGAPAPGAVPARAAAHRGDPAHPQPARGRRPQRRPPRGVADGRSTGWASGSTARSASSLHLAAGRDAPDRLDPCRPGARTCTSWRLIVGSMCDGISAHALADAQIATVRLAGRRQHAVLVAPGPVASSPGRRPDAPARNRRTASSARRRSPRGRAPAG